MPGMRKMWMGWRIWMISVVAAWAGDFRAVSWEATRAEVQKAEQASRLIEQNPAELVYQLELGGQVLFVRYSFEEDKLASARYEFDARYRQSEKYMQAYEALQGQLVRKYGAPQTTLVRCEDRFYMDYPARWGTGLVVGKLSRESTWRAGHMQIRHIIRSLPGGQVGHVVEYRPYKPEVNALENSAVFGAL